MDLKKTKETENKLQWWQLSILGVGFIIGTGFFLGSSIAIQATGPSVIITFLLAAIGTYIVFDALGKMTAKDPQKRSFSYYAEKAFGRWAGFSSGWVYWLSEMLIMGSQMTALSIFSQFWFPQIPLWVFAAVYSVLGIIVVLIGVKGFEKVENVLAVAKMAAIFMFIIIAILVIFGFIGGERHNLEIPRSMDQLFLGGVFGLWSALLYSFYAYGGIEIMGIMATRLHDTKDTPKSGKVMLVLLTTVYIISIGLAVVLVEHKAFNDKESPFIVAFNNYDLPFIPHIFNGILIIAGFSTMAAALFAVTTMLVTLAEDGNAPKWFAKKKFKKLKVPLRALSLTSAGLLISVILGLLLPDSIYEYITTAAGLMLLYNWIFILFSAKRLLKLSTSQNIRRYFGIVLIILAVLGTSLENSSRPGLYVSLSFLIIIGLVTIMLRKKLEKEA